MADMGFCGEIGLREAKENPADPENSAFDYANFAIDIRVRFKENQELRLLDKHTQSGGEKSVSTMLYLVSLQEEAPWCTFEQLGGRSNAHQAHFTSTEMPWADEGALKQGCT